MLTVLICTGARIGVIEPNGLCLLAGAPLRGVRASIGAWAAPGASTVRCSQDESVPALGPTSVAVWPCQALRHRSRESVGLVLQTIGVPAGVTPVAPAGEQNHSTKRPLLGVTTIDGPPEAP